MSIKEDQELNNAITSESRLVQSANRLRKGIWMVTCENNSEFTVRTEITTRVLFGITKNIVGDRIDKVLMARSSQSPVSYLLGTTEGPWK